MVTRRTVDLLPEIFRTPTNRKFLSATLDQLTQEPQVTRTRGFVGRRIGPGVNPADNYVREPNDTRADYQLEPGVIFLKPDTNRAQDAMTYPGMIDALDLLGADTARQDRLFQSEYYTWDPFCDLDKFTNYSQYYWLPGGPNPVDVSASTVPLTDDIAVSRTSNGYEFSGIAGENPVLTMARGGSYRFQVSQTGSAFWIQTAPGINGRLPFSPNRSSRDVLGVINNGEDLGTVTFNVPMRDAQDFFYNLADLGPVDLVTNLQFSDINNRYVDDFLVNNPQGIDGITSLNDRTLIFLNQIQNAQDGGWQITTQFDPLPRSNDFNTVTGSYDTTLFDQTTDITSIDQRYGVWQIQYIMGGDGRPFMRLNPVLLVPILGKLQVRFGDQYSGTQFYRDASGFYEEVPLLSAIEDTLWYQDGSNPDIFGQIRLIDPGAIAPIVIDDIIGARNYTSPNGVVFTNGLKVQFRGPSHPAQFQDQEYYVEGVGTGPGIDLRVGFVDGEAYYGPFYTVAGQKITGAPSADGTRQFIYDSVAESLLNMGRATSESAPLPLQGQPNAVQGNGIRLIPVRELITPETYTRNVSVPYDSTAYDSTPYDDALDAPVVQDYITINRSSRDRNAWSRSNRWFHVDVIRYAAERNNNTVIIDNEARGKRPIIEFRGNLQLFNFGTQGKLPVNIIDFSATDALSEINGSTGYGIDGYELIPGSRVIFAADLDQDVRNRIYTVEFIDPDGNVNSPPIINLVPDQDGLALANQTVVVLSGNTQQGLSFWFDGRNWIRAQQKTNVNQAPLFDVYDNRGRSFANLRFYPSSTFAGSRLFGYALGGTQITDTVLGFAVKFLNINNVGDIVFENYLYTDTFRYVKDNVGTEVDVSTGFVRQYIDRVSFSEIIGWLPAAAENRSRQTFRFVNNPGLLILDVPVVSDSVYPPVQIFLDGRFIEPENYTVSVEGDNTFISLFVPVSDTNVIEASVISDRASAVGFYQVPINLENNPLNQNSAEFTLGTIRTHYETIGQNLRDIQGPIVGANNTRDLGNISRYGQNIIQNSSPLTLAGVFLRDPEFDVAPAIRFNSQEYEKYKARLIDAVNRGDFINLTPTEILDTALQELSLSRDENSPFYWSDMIPAGETYTETETTYSVISTPVFDLRQTYDFTQSNFRALLIFVNGRLLTRGLEYNTGIGSPTVTITVPLQVGDRIVIREYDTTFGSFVPNTPTKMGLFPAYVPEIYLDRSYVTPRLVIRGHDGSITVAYGDDRDQVLLQFETRIYNNLKIASPVPLTAADVTPGQWRNTDYGLAEINQILSEDFLSWVGWNKIDYTTQNYQANNAFTYNYSQSSDRISDAPLLGAWRGIYLYFYDTTAPNTRPWEMLGFSEEPAWWQDAYGPAPYTSGNLVLWQDLSDGLVRDPEGNYVLAKYRRPGLLDVIPSDSEGNLLPPLDSVVGNFDANSFRRSWTFGDDGPAESAWRTSSAWPFAVMRLLLLTQPAKFFSLFADRDRYVYNDSLQQYLWNGRYRLPVNQQRGSNGQSLAPLYGDGVSRASYINWIIDYNRQLGVNSTVALERRLANLDVRLCWRTAAFTDKRFLKIFTERSTPTSLNTSLLLPDESYALLLYQNPAFESFQYSSVIVQKEPNGWAVLGYSAAMPYFNILTSQPNGITTTLEAGNTSVTVATQHSDDVTRVPYGYVFPNRASVCDFLISYGKLLTRQGMIFEGMENGYVMDWQQMATEFLYWSTQGWIDGSMINLNPASTRISITRPGAVAESLSPPRLDNIMLNQNRQALDPANLVIDRLDNTITLAVTGTSNDTINYFSMRFTAFEHMVVLDNRSIFADLIYDPITGARQSRVLVSGALTAGWNGTVNAPGFVLNQDDIADWTPNRVYTKGEIVRFKDELWTASTIIQPSLEFNYVLWLRSDFDEVQRGLLPNAAAVSDQLSAAYSIYNANLEQEVDLFSYGLIGFRPRRYMAALDLDDVSQVNLYQQFLGTKGTRGSLEIFSLADLGKETAEYDVFEYWAIRRGFYGANANRSYFEILLDAPRLTSNPSVIEIMQPGQTSPADQTVLVNDLWKTSYRITDTNILPVVPQEITDRALPSAGYVNIDDVNFALFDLDSLTADQVNSIGVGTTIWVAADGAYEWNVYRVEKLPPMVTQVADNLNGRSLVTFNGTHGLTVNDIVLIRFFSSDIDGSYRVLSVPSISTITIDYRFPGFQTTATGTGLALHLVTSRVAQASDVPDLTYSQSLIPGSLVWVDRDPQGQWVVLQKTQPYQATHSLGIPFPESGAGFGTSVSQGFFNLSALVGAPAKDLDDSQLNPGSVYSFLRNDRGQYQYNSVLTLTATGTAGYGNDIDIGDQDWAIAGASSSNSQQGYAVVIYRAPGNETFEQRQLLTAGDQEFDSTEFGHSVTISQDERWIYIGAPGTAGSQVGGTVYVYGRQDVQTQSVEYITSSTTLTYRYDEHIVITDNSAWQFLVVLDNELLTPLVDYAVSATSITLLTQPLSGQLLTISRRNAAQLDQQIYRGVGATGGSGSGAEFLVDRVRGVYTAKLQYGGVNYAVNDVLTIANANINAPGVGSSPANDLTITVTAVSGGVITAFTQSGSGVNNTAVFDLGTYFAQVSSIWNFSVTVNSVLQRPNQDYQFNDSTLEITFLSVPGPGALITVNADTHFAYVDKITMPFAVAYSRFGNDVSTTTDGSMVLVGAPRVASGTGECFAFSRGVERFQVQQAGTATFITSQALTAPVSVSVNGEYLVNSFLSIGGEFTVTGANSIAVTKNLAVGDIVSISVNDFSLVQILSSQETSQDGEFGAVLDQCVNDCSLYIAAPRANTTATEAGLVELWQNQARLYGSITSLVANPVLTPGDTIRINGFVVTSTGSSVTDLVQDINSALIPNVTVATTPDLDLVADGFTREFAVGSIYSATQFVGSPTTRVLLDGVLQTAGSDYVYDNSTETITFAIAPVELSVITVVSGRLILTVTNTAASIPLNRLSVLPGAGSLWLDLDLPVYVGQQIITSPVPQDFARFGSSISISDDTVTLVVGASGASLITPTTFDQGQTQFDAGSTNFVNIVPQSGAVYTYDFLPAYEASVANPGQFVFGQQIIPPQTTTQDGFGTAVDLTTGVLLMGAPGKDIGDNQSNSGSVAQFLNLENQPSWSVRHRQSPAVDIQLLNTIYIYDYASSARADYLDYFDPNQGRLLGPVAQNINYIGAVDPASYNVGPINNRGSRWAQEHVGEIWWDTTRVRFIDTNQGDITYASNRWGQTFPGSIIEIYQWISSDAPPAAYTGPGTARDDISYVLVPTINEQGIFTDVYYFWVTGSDQVAQNKTLSIENLARYIDNPRASGIPYLAPLNTSTVALYNCEEAIAQGNTVLHVEFDREINDSLVHVEYQLVPEGRPEGFLDSQLYRKLLDSFCGADTLGGLVPDPQLSPSERLGVAVRPRQSMFANRFLALENYLVAANTVLAQYPISETRSFRLLNSREPEPSAASQQWNKRVTDDQELSFQDLAQVPVGYRYLVGSDARNRGLWTIYQVLAGPILGIKTLQLVRVQNYDTRLYWRRTDWYRPGYDPLTRILLEVPRASSLQAITVPLGSSVKVTANGQGLWEIYQLSVQGWIRVALQSGTIAFSPTLWDYQLGRYGFDVEVFDSQYFDQAPIIETRQILEAINQELLIDELLIERNRLLILMFNYILSEQLSPDWLVKTSLIDVDHTIRELQPFQIYRQDNQDFVLEYINEVKPYHTQIREFGLIYRGQDRYLGDATDFDVPAYWDASKNLFISPVLDNTGTLSTTSSTPSDAAIWQQFPWDQWFQHHLLSIESVIITDGGAGYTVPPQVSVSGSAVREARMTARINGAGQVVSVQVQDPGEGYSTTAIITLVGGNGSGARAVAVMGNNMVRSITTTLRYDRYQYRSDILPWQPGQVYVDGDRVRYVDRVWQATTADSSGFANQEFDPDQWVIIPASDLSGVDRTMGYYVPSPDQPGLDLALLITGVDYPGVQVSAPDFNQNTGFDVGNYDINPFDNISFGAEGLPTYDPAILDAIYTSEFQDPFLGVLPAPAYGGAPPNTGPNAIVVDGGAFVDTFSSHAPEELVPGSVFDTLDLRVYTTPGADWQAEGHGFPVASRRYEFSTADPILSFDGLMELAVSAWVFNVTTGTLLYPTINYTIDWVQDTVTILNGASQDDIMSIALSSLGGGNQLFARRYLGTEITDTLLIPRQFNLISEIVIFVNGSPITDFSYTAQGSSDTLIDFDSPGIADNDVVVVTVLGTVPTPATSWSLPTMQYITTDGGMNYGLTDSLAGTNPVDVIVTVNGKRARPYNNRAYLSDGVTVTFELPRASDVAPEQIADNDVAVFVDDVPLTLGTGFVVDAVDGSSERTVTLLVPPAAGSRILISVRTAAQYRIVGSNLTLLPAAGLDPAPGSTLSVTTFNSTQQQNILTAVYAGPDTNFGIEINRFDVGRDIENTDRLVVTLNGDFLFPDTDYVTQGSDVIIKGPAIDPNDIVAITSFTNRLVPGSMAFRVFQDMRGLQRLYRITPDSSTVTVSVVSALDDEITVADASRLDEPNLAQGIFGLITINGERIAYRVRDVINNTVSGLRRGTAGTAAAEHAAGSAVLSIGAANLLPAPYQRRMITDNTLADGAQTEFTAASITLDTIDSTELVEAVQVFVGGVLQSSGYTILSTGPVRVAFDQAPLEGYQVSIRVAQAQVMYQQGINSASDGVPLQETDTPAARFIRGD